MGRRPRLPSVIIYVTLVALFLVCYKLVFAPVKSDTSVRGSASLQHEVTSSKVEVKVVTERKRKIIRQLNPHDFHLMINNQRLCTEVDKVALLILVSSAPSNHLKRQAIRDTWGSQGHLQSFDARVAFLLGNPGDSGIQTQVTEESRAHGDILQEDFIDSYMNLTLKSVMGLKWVSNHCMKAEFIMKTDDDIYVNINTLINYLHEGPRARVITGCIKQNKAFMPVNMSPGAAPLPPAHPPFAAGAGYVISGDIVRELYMASLRTRLMPVEDVYVTAHLGKAIGVHPPIHHTFFTCGEAVLDDCLLAQTFTGHRISPDRMYQIWDKLNPNGINSPCFDF